MCMDARGTTSACMNQCLIGSYTERNKSGLIHMKDVDDVCKCSYVVICMIKYLILTLRKPL